MFTRFQLQAANTGIDAWLEAQVIHPTVAATIGQTSFERSLHDQEHSSESAEAQPVRVVSKHLKEDHMGLMVQLEHILATAVGHALVRTTYPLLPPKLNHHTAKLCFRCAGSPSLQAARRTLAHTSSHRLAGPGSQSCSPTQWVLCHAQAMLQSHPPALLPAGYS